MKEMILLLVSAALVNNVVLSQFLGLCPFLGVSKKTNTAAGMGGAVTFVVTLSSAITWLINEFVLKKAGLVYMQTIVFILVIAALVQVIEMFLKKNVPALYKSLGVYLPLITTNCAVLGTALNNISYEHNLLQSIVYGFGISCGFTIAIVIMAGVRERIEYNPFSESFKGTPMVLITAGLMAMAFMGFSGLL